MGEERALRARAHSGRGRDRHRGAAHGDDVQLRNPLMGVDHVLRACTPHPHHTPHERPIA